MDRKSLKMSFLSISVLLLAFIFVPIPGRPSALVYLKEKTIRAHLDSFDDPVFLPSGSFRENTTYSTYLGWNSAYVIRFTSIQSAEKTITADIIQFNSQSTLVNIAREGPSNDALSAMKDFALTRTDCVDFDKPNQVFYCSDDGFEYLLRIVIDQENTYYLASSVEHEKTTQSVQPFAPQQNSIQHRLLKAALPIEKDDAREYILIQP
jgi:hypothetical protein